jgi:hypothetical protein
MKSYSGLKAKLDRNGYILRTRNEGFMITDLRGLPVHETDQTPFSQTLDDVKEWVAVLCD